MQHRVVMLVGLGALFGCGGDNQTAADASSPLDAGVDSFVPTSDASADATDGSSNDAANESGIDATTPMPQMGWAFWPGNGVTTTTGGGNATPVTVTTVADFNTQAAGTTAAVIQISGTLSGNLSIGSNKTIVGLSGAKVVGHIQMTSSVNVIVQNLTVVGYNCTDAQPCEDGADAITVEGPSSGVGAHHIWFDHLDVSDGSDGNLDMTHASDNITISWTKFHYSSARTDPEDTGAAGHRFSNLIGHSDTNGTQDTGHLNITFHHVWWADYVVERQPRVRFGQVHIFDSLYTGVGNDYCIGLGVGANINDEDNVFVGVKNPIDSTDYSDSTSIIVSNANVYTTTTGTTADKGGPAFTPPYPYILDPASQVQASVQAGVGPK